MKNISILCIYASFPILSLWICPTILLSFPNALSFEWLLLAMSWYAWLFYQVYQFIDQKKELFDHWTFPLLLYLFAFLLLRECTGISRHDKVLPFYAFCMSCYSIYMLHQQNMHKQHQN